MPATGSEPLEQTTHAYLPHTLELLRDNVVKRIESWFQAEGRSFPWRLSARDAALAMEHHGRVNDPYIVLLSEVMLQQTQAARVAQILPQFVARFPTIEALAVAKRGDVLRAWSGLGYNTRALRLHRTAIEIVQLYGGEFPRDPVVLLQLSGIGPYTAAAVACFAFGAHVAVVDVNIQRVLSRLFYRCHTVSAVQSVGTITKLDEALMPHGGGYGWHQALMDFGATVCTARRPACERCPLASSCLSAFPSQSPLFGTARLAERLVLGEPRRIWRGRIVERMRNINGSIAVGDLLRGLMNTTARVDSRTIRERRELIEVIASLVDEGILMYASGTVQEPGALDEFKLIRLIE